MAVPAQYKCTLDEKDIQVAALNLNEPRDDDGRLQKINELRKAFLKQKGKERLADNSDEFLLRFLRARKFNINDALMWLNNYCYHYENWPEVFSKVRNPDMVKHLFEKGVFFALKEKAIDGSTVFISRYGLVEESDLYDQMALFLISVNHLLEEERNQVYGITVILDKSTTTFEVMQQLLPFYGKQFLDCIQKAMPIQMKAVHFVYESKFFDAIFAVARVFLDSGVKKVLYSHGKKFETLHNYIKSSSLPPKYGGTGESSEILTQQWLKQIYGGPDELGISQSGVELSF